MLQCMGESCKSGHYIVVYENMLVTLYRRLYPRGDLVIREFEKVPVGNRTGNLSASSLLDYRSIVACAV